MKGIVYRVCDHLASGPYLILCVKTDEEKILIIPCRPHGNMEQIPAPHLVDKGKLPFELVTVREVEVSKMIFNKASRVAKANDELYMLTRDKFSQSDL